MLKKLASPKKKSLAQAKDLTTLGDETGATPQQESPSKPQQSEEGDIQPGENLDEKAIAQDEQHKHNAPALERQSRRRSVLEEKPPPSDEKKRPSKLKPAAKLSKKGEVKAIPEEKPVDAAASDTEKEENQGGGDQHQEELSSSKKAGKSERGFLKSLRGHRASSSGDQHVDAATDTEKEAPKSKKKSKEKQRVKESKTEKSASTDKRKQKDKAPNEGGVQHDRDEKQDNNKDGKVSKEDHKAPSRQSIGSMSPIRRRLPPKSGKGGDLSSKLKNQFTPLSQTEVHIIGEIVGGGGFPGSSDGLICKWHVDYGGYWTHISGHELGQTQIAYPSQTSSSNQFENLDFAAVWAHPIDVHLASNAFQGWPKLVFQVWQVDTHMSTRIAGYGFVSVPFAHGEYELNVQLWRPMGGSWISELSSQLTGNTPELVTDDVVARSAISDRCRLQTVATGHVRVRVGVLLRNIELLNEGLSR